MMGWLLVPFALPFMRNALAVGLIVALVCAVLSCFLVLRGASLMGDAISHAVLPGMVLAAAIGVPAVIGAFASGLACAAMSRGLQGHPRIKPDAALGLAFAGLFALGLVLFSMIETGQDLLHILFGNILGVSRADVIETALIGTPVLVSGTRFPQGFVLVSFDRTQAQAIGLPVRRLEWGFLVGLALAIVAALKAVGVILVAAMLIGPGATGWLLARRFPGMLLVASVSAVLATLAGLLLSFHLDIATGPLIVLCQAAIVALALLFAPGKGALRRPAPFV